MTAFFKALWSWGNRRRASHIKRRRRAAFTVFVQLKVVLLVPAQRPDLRGERAVHIAPVGPECVQIHARALVDEFDILDPVRRNRTVLDDQRLDRHDDLARDINEGALVGLKGSHCQADELLALDA